MQPLRRPRKARCATHCEVSPARGNVRCARTAPRDTPVLVPTLRKADAIVVFGAAVWPDGPSMTLRVRVARAAELHAQGLAPTILCTGGRSNGRSEARVMRAILLAHGVAGDAVIADDGGINTRQALRSVRRFGDGLWRIIAVSSPYHMARIGSEARRQGIDAQLCPAQRPGQRSWRLLAFDVRQYMREAVAVPAYALGWQLEALRSHPPVSLAVRAARHAHARVRFLLRDADAVAAAGDAIARRIKEQVANFSDTETVLTSASGLRWPVRGSIGSRFGLRHGRLHAGLDLRAAYGAPVVSAASGNALLIATLGPYGNVAVIDHGGGLATAYAHLAGFTIDEGERIADGQRIGFVGETGRSSGPHLHFEVRIHGSPVDPLAYLASPA
jgi:vancomycin permeability regulator SanA